MLIIVFCFLTTKSGNGSTVEYDTFQSTSANRGSSDIDDMYLSRPVRPSSMAEPVEGDATVPFIPSSATKTGAGQAQLAAKPLLPSYLDLRVYRRVLVEQHHLVHGHSHATCTFVASLRVRSVYLRGHAMQHNIHYPVIQLM